MFLFVAIFFIGYLCVCAYFVNDSKHWIKYKKETGHVCVYATISIESPRRRIRRRRRHTPLTEKEVSHNPAYEYIHIQGSQSPYPLTGTMPSNLLGHLTRFARHLYILLYISCKQI